MKNWKYITKKACEYCNTLITAHPTDPYGNGDIFFSCEVCDWFSEEDYSSSIKQGLTLEETVSAKIAYNKVNDYILKQMKESYDYHPELWVLMQNLKQTLVDIPPEVIE